MKNMYGKMIVAVAAVMAASPAFAQEGAVAGAEKVGPLAGIFAQTGGWIGLGAGLAMAIAVLGGTLSQAKVAAAALDGTARNPAAAGKFTAPLFVGLALIESLVILTFVIANNLAGQNTNMLKAIMKVLGVTDIM